MHYKSTIMNLKYLFGALISIPLLPILYFQAKRIRKSVPQLPEAKGIEGKCSPSKKYDKTVSILTLGESTIAGVGVESHEEGFTGTLANQLANKLHVNTHWKVQAKSGFTAKEVTTKLVPTLTDSFFDIIFIGLGGNDAFQLNTPWKWQRDCKLLIKSIKEKYPEAIIVFCNMPPIKEFPAFTPLAKFVLGNLGEILGDSLSVVVEQFDDVFYFKEKITLEDWMRRFDLQVSKEDFFSDGVHPSKLTYQTWARDIARKIDEDEGILDLLFKP